MDKDIKEILFVYITVILTCWILGLKFELSKSYNEKIEIMKIAIENDRLNQEYISVLQESRDQLAEAYNYKNAQLEDNLYLERLKKDIR